MTDPSSGASLPRLAYIGEVPVLNISAGPALLYRLLESYPRDRLLVCVSDDNPPDPIHELPGVEHRPFHLMNRRLLRSRFTLIYAAWVYRRAAAHGRALASRLRSQDVEAVLGVGHGFGWLPAAAAARELGVPFHFIVHDHWRGTITLPKRLEAEADQAFADIYRSATTRMPVSPDMEAHYRRIYGVGGSVVYPNRSLHALQLAQPPLRPPKPGAFIFAYAGSAHSSGQRRALADFANAIAPLGARLRIYQGLTLAQLRHDGLQTDNVELEPFRPSAELHADLAARVDAMYLPMSYTAEDRANVELCFPSKLADYTVAGLPILVRAPAYGTATNWARSNPGVAELVTAPGTEPLAAAARRVIEDDAHRHALAYAALAVGQRMFSHRAVFEVFSACLRSANHTGP